MSNCTHSVESVQKKCLNCKQIIASIWEQCCTQCQERDPFVYICLECNSAASSTCRHSRTVLMKRCSNCNDLGCFDDEVCSTCPTEAKFKLFCSACTPLKSDRSNGFGSGSAASPVAFEELGATGFTPRTEFPFNTDQLVSHLESSDQLQSLSQQPSLIARLRDCEDWIDRTMSGVLEKSIPLNMRDQRHNLWRELQDKKTLMNEVRFAHDQQLQQLGRHVAEKLTGLKDAVRQVQAKDSREHCANWQSHSAENRKSFRDRRRERTGNLDEHQTDPKQNQDNGGQQPDNLAGFNSGGEVNQVSRGSYRGSRGGYHSGHKQHHGSRGGYDGSHGEHSENRGGNHGNRAEHHGIHFVHHGMRFAHHGNRGEQHGNRGEHHGNRGGYYGNRGEHHGNRGEHHGNHGEHHGNRGEHHGNRGEHHGNRGEHHGNHGEHHGNRDEHHGNRGEHHGNRDESHGSRGRWHDTRSSQGSLRGNHGMVHHRGSWHRNRTDQLSSNTTIRRTPITEENEETTVEYFAIHDRVTRYAKAEHRIKLDIQSIEKIKNPVLDRRLQEVRVQLFNKSGRRELLIHGTKSETAELIIQEGFKVGTSGMFGAGIYFATDSTKSAQYCKENGVKSLLICEVLLGKTMVCEAPRKDLNFQTVRALGYDSVFAKRNTKGTGGVANDEYIVYRAEQATPRYLVKFGGTDCTIL